MSEALETVVIKGNPITSGVITGTEVNPKTLAGAKKLDPSYIPAAVGVLVSEALKTGAEKYGVKNWIDSPVPARTYVAACERHLKLWFEGGQEVADDSGCHHLAHAIAGLMVVFDAMLHNNMIDDRPTPSDVVVKLLSSQASEINQAELTTGD